MTTTILAEENTDPETTASDSRANWRQIMKEAVRTAAELRSRVGLPPETLQPGCESFPTFVPEPLLQRIHPGDPDDPILKQVLAVAAESDTVPGFVSDPVGDLAQLKTTGLIQKYDRRALLITTGACAVHCRYCFRREFPYSDQRAGRDAFAPAIRAIRADESLSEILLSGGDPLTLVDESLFQLIDELESIPHLKRLRIHSRLPIAIPQRITRELVERLRQSRLTVWMVIHCNHEQELDDRVFAATDRLIDHGIPVLNQAVLLRGINDSAEALVSLCEKLVDHRIQPYYLHRLDPVNGAAHFDVTADTGRELIDAIRTRLPGYAVPQLVAEIAGKQSKTSL